MLEPNGVSLPQDRWAVPGTRTTATLFPSIEDAFRRGELTQKQAQKAIDRELHRAMVRSRHKGLESQEGIQRMHLRIATMDAAGRLDPAKGTPAAMLAGIAGTLKREQFRRQPPAPVSLDSIAEMAVEGDQLEAAERRETLAELAECMSKLSRGEIRALLAECGPLFEYSRPISPRRSRCIDSDALPRAFELISRLRAHRKPAI